MCSTGVFYSKMVYYHGNRRSSGFPCGRKKRSLLDINNVIFCGRRKLSAACPSVAVRLFSCRNVVSRNHSVSQNTTMMRSAVSSAATAAASSSLASSTLPSTVVACNVYVSAGRSHHAPLLLGILQEAQVRLVWRKLDRSFARSFVRSFAGS